MYVYYVFMYVWMVQYMYICMYTCTSTVHIHVHTYCTYIHCTCTFRSHFQEPTDTEHCKGKTASSHWYIYVCRDVYVPGSWRCLPANGHCSATSLWSRLKQYLSAYVHVRMYWGDKLTVHVTVSSSFLHSVKIDSRKTGQNASLLWQLLYVHLHNVVYCWCGHIHVHYGGSDWCSVSRV